MSNGSAIRAGRAFIEMFADNNPLTKGLKGSESILKSWGGKVAGIGKQIFTAFGAAVGGGLGVLTAAGLAFGDMAGEIVDLSAKTGVGTDALQELGYAASQTGTDLGTVEKSIKKMQDNIVQAASGNKTLKASFAAIGVSVDELRKLSPEQQFARIADGLARISNPAQRTSLAMDILGKSGTDLLPMLANGSKGLEQFGSEARELGLVMAGEDLKAADDFGDSLVTLFKQVKAAGFSIAAAFLPELQSMVLTSQDVIGMVVAWVKENKNLIVTVGKVIAGIAAGAAVIYAIGTAMTVAGMAAGVLAAGIAFALSPLGLVLIAVAALTAGILYLTGGMETLKNDAIAAFGGIADALAAGNIALAADILWAALKLQWAAGTAWLDTQWTECLNAMVQVASSITKTIGGLFIDMVMGTVKQINSLEQMLSEFIGTDLVSPQKRVGINMAANVMGALAKSQLGGSVDSFSSSFSEQSQGRIAASEAAVAAAGEEFSRLVDQAAQEREAAAGKGPTANPKVTAVETGALEMNKVAKEVKGIGFEDVRSKEGFKAIAQALRGGDAADQTAKNTAKLASNSDQIRRDTRDTRDAIVGLRGTDFRG